MSNRIGIEPAAAASSSSGLALQRRLFGVEAAGALALLPQLALDLLVLDLAQDALPELLVALLLLLASSAYFCCALIACFLLSLGLVRGASMGPVAGLVGNAGAGVVRSCRARRG